MDSHRLRLDDDDHIANSLATADFAYISIENTHHELTLDLSYLAAIRLRNACEQALNRMATSHARIEP